MHPMLTRHQRRATDAEPEPALTREQMAWAIGGLCRAFRIPFDAQLLQQQVPPPYDWSSLQAAATLLGMRSSNRSVRLSSIGADFLPCLVPLRVDSTEAQNAWQPALIVRIEHGEALYFVPGEAEPRRESVEALTARHAGVALFATPERPDPETDGEAAKRPFGFRWFIPELLKYRPIWRDVLIASLAIQCMALAMPLFTQAIIDKVVVHRTQSTLTVIAVALGLFMVFSAGMTWARQYLVIHTGTRIDAALGLRVFEHLFRLPPRYFEQRPTGVMVARLHGVETIREFMSGAAVTLVLDVPFLFVFLALMLWYSWQLTLIAVAIMFAIAALGIAITPVLRARLNRQFMLGARNQAFVTEYVAGMDTVKSLQMEAQLTRRYGGYLSDYLRASFDTRRLASTYQVCAGGLEQLMSLSILCVGAWLAMTEPGFTIGMLVAFQMFSSRLSQPLLRMVGLWQEFQQAAIAVKRLGDIMDVPSEPCSAVPGRAHTMKGAIEIRNLAFRYSDEMPWLYREFDLEIKPGSFVAIMGPSGSGKSTLAKLLQGFYPPGEGAIRIDGYDVRGLSANELRRYFGVVPQETILFSGTIYDNLVIADPHASFDDVVVACRLAEVHDVIERLPQGYQTTIGEGGSGLSGGQRQRIAIARALLKRPPILVFDEATSNLDTQTAESFVRTVNRLAGQATVLFITHHLPVDACVDKVVHIGAAPVQPEADAEREMLAALRAAPQGVGLH
jgi:subfamily B ATP-binding cassette protein HlyB/CyaB